MLWETKLSMSAPVAQEVRRLLWRFWGRGFDSHCVLKSNIQSEDDKSARRKALSGPGAGGEMGLFAILSHQWQHVWVQIHPVADLNEDRWRMKTRRMKTKTQDEDQVKYEDQKNEDQDEEISNPAKTGDYGGHGPPRSFGEVEAGGYEPGN